ncbi:endonuclease/exonuclease/phosphatase family protein [Loktanella sp. S4079]|uniref:endonuclease/exonuclease/phosphatase family protein n=1 Tax=Loktanella sp. S4079 TaxID=579483 RepID=UPI0005FA10AE|nr:endonuclease/exonuclease/phosphatase family protein [Loktanella sp. S4079]
MRVLFRWLAAFSLCLVCFVILVGFAGRLHPIADSIALLRMPLGIVCLLALVFPMARVMRRIVGVAALVALGTTLPLLLNWQQPGTLSLYSKNMLYRNGDLSSLAADIRESGAQVVTLQEVGTRNDALLAILKDDYPHQHLCRFSGWSGVAVLSKTEFVAPAQCSGRRGAAAARIAVDGEAVWVTSVHLPWPYPYNHAESADSVVAMLTALDGPVVIGGDFNTFPWASSVREIRQASDTRIAGPTRPTFNLYGAPLFLDHVYAPGGGTVSYRDFLGSDHLGVLARVSLS